MQAPLTVGFLNPANSVTLLRLPLAALIWKARGKKRLTLAIVAAAGVTDVLDGWLARRSRSGPDPAGSWLDPLCDKIFVLSALGSVTLARRPPAWVPWLVASREVLQLSFSGVFLGKGRRPEVPVRFDFTAAPIGKAATLLQFTAIGGLLLRRKWANQAAVLSAVAGTWAAFHYLERALALSGRRVPRKPDYPSLLISPPALEARGSY